MSLRAPLAAAAAAAAFTLLAGEAGAARPPLRIDERGIGPVVLGSAATAIQGSAEGRGRTVDGLDRLAFPADGLAVLVQPASGRVAGVVAWSSRWTTGLGVGPCSSERTLRAAYGSRLETVVKGKGVRALRAGRLVFALDDAGVVLAVLVADARTVSPLAALDAPACGLPSL